MKRHTPFVLLGFILLLLLVQLDRRPSAATAWQSKVDQWVLDEMERTGSAEFLVFLTDQADLSAARTLTGKAARTQYVYDTLTAHAATTQQPIRAYLDGARADYRPFWVANMLWVRGDADLLAALAQRSDVDRLAANPTVRLDASPGQPTGPGLDAIEWNINQINAPDVWALGYTGQGVVIAGQDTGYQWTHPSLKARYRGWDGAVADHNYNWHDAISSGGGICGPDTTEPCDDYGHGTHTMGTMVGNDLPMTDPGWPELAPNVVGVAPGAQWIGCRNMDVGNGTPATYSECFEWFIAPTDLNGLNPDPSRAPHVINNSWSCPVSEGCTDPNVLKTVVENTRAAGIMVVVSAGNSGSACSTVNTPAAIYDASFSIGATTSTDAIASFSSRGPVTLDGSNRLKPDVSAPGVSVRSSTLGGSYGLSSGTSMAAPHVAGVVALLIEANPLLEGDVDALEAILTESAEPLTTTQTCGGVPGDQIPNNTFGYGRLDALAAVELALAAPPDKVYLSFVAGGTVGGLDLAPNDIALYERAVDAWRVFLDGDAVGLSGLNIDGFVVLSGDRVAFSLDTAASLPGVGQVQPEDIVLYTPLNGSLRLVFDGSDVGLSGSAENIDAITVTANGDMLVSVAGDFAVPGATGKAQDLLRFVPTAWGQNTSGTWSLWWDGSTVAMNAASEDIWGVTAVGPFDSVYLTTSGDLQIGPFTASGADIVYCTHDAPGAPTACADSGHYWLGADAGHAALSIDGFDLELVGQNEEGRVLRGLDE